MIKRQLILNGYKTAESGLWTLASLKITKASQVQNFVSVPGRFAPLDLSTILTDGQPYYGNANLEAVLESSEGTREDRQERITEMVNFLDGYIANIIHPDHPNHYMVGRVQVTKEYNDPVHARVKVSAVCEPWLYNEANTVTAVDVAGSSKNIILLNKGRLGVMPEVSVTGEVTIAGEGNNATLSAGTYALPWLYLPATGGPTSPNGLSLQISGTGTVTFTYREAVLAE